MNQAKCIPLYLVLAAVNGIVPFIIALLFSVSIMYAVLIWGLATASTFLFISLVCMRSAIKQSDSELEEKPARADLEKAPIYR